MELWFILLSYILLEAGERLKKFAGINIIETSQVT